MKDMENTYEGWKNSSTWLVNLRIDNEYNTYMAKIDALRHRRIEDITPKFAKDTAKELLGRGFFNDGGSIGQVDWAEVDWAEIAESWAAEAADLREHEEA